MVAVLTKIFGTQNLELAEDVVQDTLLQAMQTWSLRGAPANPSAWLYKVARNKAIDIIRKNKFSVQYDFSDGERALLASEYTLSTIMENMWQEDVIKDDLLRMMFACCHPDLSSENQITLILKTLCAFSTSEIAKSFLTTEGTISKRLYRTKEFFRERKIKPEYPPPDQLPVRLHAVLRAIYLIFNEGYNSSHSDIIIREDLLDQAMYLCDLLCTHTQTQLPEVYATMALMYYHAARINSRIGAEGEIILLSSQDRAKWDRAMIARGNEYLEKAAFGDSLTTYHVEAAIAYEHCNAQRFEDTNWLRILGYYDCLYRLAPSPVVLLNRLTVIFKIYGAEKTMEELGQADNKTELEKSYLYHSLLGEILTLSDPGAARRSYERAIDLTQNSAEKKLLARKISNLSTAVE
jgi:RNA polymerase sigma factor (sigma-70 family)